MTFYSCYLKFFRASTSSNWEKILIEIKNLWRTIMIMELVFEGGVGQTIVIREIHVTIYH